MARPTMAVASASSCGTVVIRFVSSRVGASIRARLFGDVTCCRGPVDAEEWGSPVPRSRELRARDPHRRSAGPRAAGLPRPHRHRAAPRARARRRAVHRRVREGDRAGARAGHRPRSVLRAGEVAGGCRAAGARRRLPVFVVAAEVAEALTGYAVHRGALAAMHRPALPSVARGRRGCAAAWWCSRTSSTTPTWGRSSARSAGLGADAVLVTPALRRPPVPPERAGFHGDGVAGAVDPAAGVGRGARPPARGGAAHRRAGARRRGGRRSTSSSRPGPSGWPSYSGRRAMG